jgi:hypothetical protein
MDDFALFGTIDHFNEQNKEMKKHLSEILLI